METKQQIADGILAYSREHEGDALADDRKATGFRGWEIPYYCWEPDEALKEVEEGGWNTTKEAIKDLTKWFKIRAEIADDIRNS